MVPIGLHYQLLDLLKGLTQRAMDRAFDPPPVPHHCVAIRDVLSFPLDALRLAHRIGPVDGAAKLLELVLDGPYELVDGEITQGTPNMRVRKPVRLTVLLFELDEESDRKPVFRQLS